MSELSYRNRFLETRRAEAPSTGGEPANFAKKQETDGKIFCGQPPETSPPIPLTLLHPIFAQFVDDCEHSQPSHQINKFTFKFANSMSKFYPNESARENELKNCFSELGIIFEKVKISGTRYEIDAGIEDNRFLIVCGEIKNDPAKNAADPFLQATLYYLERTRVLAPIFPSSTLPVLIVICSGALLNLSCQQ